MRRLLRKAASGAKLSKAQLASISKPGLIELVRAEAPARVGAQLVEVAQAAAGASVDSGAVSGVLGSASRGGRCER